MTLRLNGDGSGFTEIKAPNAAGDNSITLPTSNGSAFQLLRNDSVAGQLSHTSSSGGLHYDSTGRLLVNTSTNTDNYKLQVDSSVFTVAQFTRYVSDGATVVIGSSRGTQASKTALNDNDYAGLLDYKAHTGTNFKSIARVSAQMEADAAVGDLPGRLSFWTTPAGDDSPQERVQIGSTGEIRLLTDCPGIDFSRIQTNQSGMASETLANYERGSFTPSFENINAFDYSARTGSYVRVGEMVTVYIRLSTINAGGVNGTSTVKIAGLPFPVRFSGNAGLNCLALTHDNRFINNPQFGQVQSGSQTKIVLFKDKSMHASSAGLTADADFTKTNSANYNLMSINFTYEIDIS